jgi:Tol biopolymer transport system component
LKVDKANFYDAQVSLDGHWLAYTSNESGRDELYLTRFPEGGGTLRVSRAGGVNARWRRDGREIYFIDAEHWLVACEMDRDAAGEIATGRQTRLFQIPLGFAATGDGQRFLVAEQLSEGDVSPITIRTGWERAPVQ